MPICRWANFLFEKKEPFSRQNVEDSRSFPYIESFIANIKEKVS